MALSRLIDYTYLGSTLAEVKNKELKTTLLIPVVPVYHVDRDMEDV